METKVLIVDDDDDILAAGKMALRKVCTDITTLNDPKHLPRVIEENSFDLVLLDMNFNPGNSDGAEGLHWIEELQKLKFDGVILAATAHGGVNIAVEAMKRGAQDFIIKPWQNEKFVATIKNAIELRQSKLANQKLERSQSAIAAAVNTTHNMLGESIAMKNVHSMIAKAAPTDANVLILGENGTGKELAARELHQQSHRADKVFISVDMGALSEQLFESELFGHKKGAFTGAMQERPGRFQAANGGTLFLDEIGNLPLSLQSKLLTVLEQRVVTALGSDKSEAVDVRIIAATNVPREKLHDEAIFRQDLLYRLNTVEICMPPLRERKEDIAEISQYYLTLYAKKYHKACKNFDEYTLTALTQCDWPGNIRSLRHAIERAVILCEGESISENDLQLRQSGSEAQAASTGGSHLNANAILASNPNSSTQNTETLTLDELELRAVKSALTRHRYNISRAAKDLGITRAALYRRMEKHDL